MKRHGFTLIEIMVSLAIMMIVGFSGIVGLNAYARSLLVDEYNIARMQLVEARAKSFFGDSVTVTLKNGEQVTFTQGTSAEKTIDFTSGNQTLHLHISDNGRIF